MDEATKSATPNRSLVRKLAEVMGEVGYIPKSGRNEFHKYNYATEADIVAAVREKMAKRLLMIFPDVEKSEFRTVEKKSGGKDFICTLTVNFTVEDGESGETRSFRVVGEGQDVGDKASYKALTGAEKYAILKLFLIPTGDDPEKDEEPSKRAPTQAAAKKSAEPKAPEKSAELRRRSAEVWRAAQAKGITRDTWAPWVARVVGEPKATPALTAEDLDKLEMTLEQMQQQQPTAN